MNSGIYMWISPSGKAYIGQAINLKKRAREFKRPNSIYTSKGSAIDNARAKYNDFSKWQYSVLEECDIEQLEEKEIYYIEKYNTYNKGYNSTKGGDGTKGIKLTEERKQKLLEGQNKARLEGKYDSWYNSKELKRQTSEQFKGRVWTDEQRQQISNSLKGRKHTEEEKSKVSEALKEKYANGYVNEGQIKAVSKPVLQYTLEGELVNEFCSLSNAANFMGKKDPKQIRKVCQGKKDSVYGYIWKFKE